MTALVWRLHRGQAVVAAVVLAVLLAALIPTGIHMDAVYRAAVADCAGTGSCPDLGSSLFQGDGLILDLVLATLAVPAVLGMFVGAPAVAKEGEDRTLHLVWTQSVSRRRWLATTSGWLLLAAAVLAAAVCALVAWWARPENAMNGRVSPGAFDIQGIVPVAYAVFAVALGVAIGAAVRRPLPAVAITVAVFTAVRVAVFRYLRPHYLPPLHASLPLADNQPDVNPTWWVVDERIVDPHGHVLTGPLSARSVCPGGHVTVDCLAAHGYQRALVYQPDSRFWPLQGIETGLFLLLALACLAVAYWLVTRRDA